MSAIEFTDEQVERLAFERFHHPHPRVQRKIEAVFLKAKGLSHAEVCELVGISRTTLWGWLRDFQAGGVEGLQQGGAGGSTSTPTPSASTLSSVRPTRSPQHGRPSKS